MRLLKLGFTLVCLLFLQIEAVENEEETNPCPGDSIPCDNGQCVRRGDWCDGQKNCEDKSDEKYCKKAYFWSGDDPNRCKKTHFLCFDGRCVPRVAKCDGHFDCKDKSDENSCGKETQDEYSDYEETESTSDIQTTITETYMEVNEVDDPDFSTTPSQAPTLAFTQGALLPSTVNFYANRMEQERGQIPLESLPTVHSPSVTSSESAPAPERHHSNSITQNNTTSRSFLSTASPTTRAYENKRSHYPSPTPVPVYPKPHVPKRHPETPLHPTVYPPVQYNRQTNIPIHQSTRSYVGAQYPNQQYTQRSIPYDSRVYNQYPSQQPIRYDNRRTYPYQYPTPPTRSYGSRRDSYQYHYQPTSQYDSRRDHQQYQTQSTAPYDYGRTNSPNHYTGVTQRVYEDQINYYDGYYNQNGRFVVLYRTNQRQQSYGNPPPEARRNRQDPDIPATVPTVFERHLKAPSLFYFAKSYSRIYGDGNVSYVRKGKEWILSIRNSTGGWGKDTPRALIALSLINNSFVNNTYENDVMQKYFQVYLGTRLLRGEAETTSLNRLAMAINALIATCQNPKDFHGTDLTDLIQRRLERMNQRDRGNPNTRTISVNPSVYLSLCLADRDLTHFQEQDLISRLRTYVLPGEYSRDMLSLSISALSCHLRRLKFRDSEYQRSLNSMLSNATTKLLERMKDDGSFGSVYGTALAAQALMSLNDTKHWDPESTLDFLKEHQKSDGSFGDFLATYLVLPVLSGRSLLHLRNTQCTPPKSDRDLTPSEILAFSGPKQYVRYSLYIGYPKVNGYSIELLVPKGISFYDMMRVAQHENDDFKFTYEERNGEIYVYSISNIPNDAEQGLEWNLYAKRSSDFELNTINDQERILGDIREFYPSSDQHIIFWYHPIGIRT